ncbi:MAG: DnaB-like helicase N-terminal domain-containing protein, partial [Gemmatimonadaceae bacterium]
MSSLLDDSSTAPQARDAYRDRRPPFSEDAEQAVLSAMMMDRNAIVRAAEFVDETMFYREAHRRIFRAMLALSERGSVVDVLTLSDELARRGELEAAGGKDYLSLMVDAVPTSANVEYHARIIREKAVVRRLIETSTEIVGEAFDGRTTSADLLDRAEQRIFQINQTRKAEGFHRMKELLWTAMERIE